jgi:hypothetical protein
MAAEGLLTIVPTRNRVENALGLLDTFYKMSVENSSGLLFVVGTEDPALEKYKQKIPKNHLLIFPDRGLVKALNYASVLYVKEYEAIGFMGDDHRPRTPGWDRSYLESLRELGSGYVYGNDLLMGERIPTQVAISSPIIETLGFFGPPGFTHLCVDLTWKDMGVGLGRIKYLDDVIVEHMHPANGKAENDSGYKFVNSPEMVKKDTEEYFRWKKCDLPHQLARVADTLGIVLESTHDATKGDQDKSQT